MPHCRSVLSYHGKILYTLSEYYSLLCIFFLDCSFLLFLNPYIVVIYVQSSVDFKLWRKIAGIMASAKWTFCFWHSSAGHQIVGNLCFSDPRHPLQQPQFVIVWGAALFLPLWHSVSFYTCSSFIFPTKQTEFSHCLRGSQMSVRTKQPSDKNILNTECFWRFQDPSCIEKAMKDY